MQRHTFMCAMSASARSCVLGGHDLAARWNQLVVDGAVTSSAPNPAGGEPIRYGVRLAESGAYEEWVDDEMLSRALQGGGSRRTLSAPPFVAQLQLLRTLRPPPTPNLAALPPYDESTDSFVTGPLRLELRPRAAELVAQGGRHWDCYHNVAPCDPRGHFLLLPSIQDRQNWRRQALTREDCIDLIWLACGSDGSYGAESPRADRLAEEPIPIESHQSGLLLCFNSIRAGASQNHIHCQAWPSPPLGITMPYAAQLAGVREGETGPLLLNLHRRQIETVQLALLEYPVACVRIMPLDGAFDEEGVMCAGGALAELAAAFEKCGWPFNVVASGGHLFVFVRSADAERSPQLPMLKLGSSEMMVDTTLPPPLPPSLPPSLPFKALWSTPFSLV